MGTIFLILFFVSIIGLVYCVYQLLRNNEVWKIRRNWITDDDYRWYEYPYDEMFDPSKNNWFGLRWPKDEHFK